MTIKKETRGGSRKGAGRPKKEPTVTLSYRVPEKHAAKISVKLKAIITKIKKASSERKNWIEDLVITAVNNSIIKTKK